MKLFQGPTGGHTQGKGARQGIPKYKLVNFQFFEDFSWHSIGDCFVFEQDIEYHCF